MADKQKKPDKRMFYGGTAVLAGIAGYGLFGIQKRNIRLSLYLINMRLAAQGTFVGILTVGSAVLLYQRLTGQSDPDKFNITRR